MTLSSAKLPHVVHMAHSALERCRRFVTSRHRTRGLWLLPVSLMILSVVVFSAIAACSMWIVAPRNGAWLAAMGSIYYWAIGVSFAVLLGIGLKYHAFSQQVQRFVYVIIHKACELHSHITSAVHGMNWLAYLTSFLCVDCKLKIEWFQAITKHLQESEGRTNNGGSELGIAPLARAELDRNATIPIKEAANKVTEEFIGYGRHFKGEALGGTDIQGNQGLAQSSTENAEGIASSFLSTPDRSGIGEYGSELFYKISVLADKANSRDGSINVAITSNQSKRPSHFRRPGFKQTIVGIVSSTFSSFNGKPVSSFRGACFKTSIDRMMAERGWENTKASRYAAQALFLVPMALVEFVRRNLASRIKEFCHCNQPPCLQLYHSCRFVSSITEAPCQ